MLTVFFSSRLWRRAGVMTDVELTELRYGGKPAALLRGARALYLGLPINLIIMGWVTRAMVTILDATLGLNGLRAAIVLLAITAGYSMLSGLWGVVMTDLFQFIFAMGGSIVLAVVAVRATGGLDRLVELTAAHFGSHGAAFGILPPLDSPWLPLSSLLVFLAVQWWAAWYPGAEPGGGGYVAQRIFSTRDERQGLLSTLWFNVAHYAVRPWPWILVGCFTVVRYPGLANPEQGYVKAMVDLLPSPLRGMMLAAFAAAYMSTISTHLNWGASYLVNDVWLRFVRRGASSREQVLVSVGVTTVAWIAVTFLTAPERAEVLDNFYRRVRPGGAGWRTVARRLGYGDDPIPGGSLAWVNWVAGWVAVYAALFGIGQLLVGTIAGALAFLAVAAGAFAVIARNLRRDASFRPATVDSPGTSV